MTNSPYAIGVVDQKGRKVSRSKAMIAATFISLSGFVFMLPQPAAVHAMALVILVAVMGVAVQI